MTAPDLTEVERNPPLDGRKIWCALTGSEEVVDMIPATGDDQYDDSRRTRWRVSHQSDLHQGLLSGHPRRTRWQLIAERTRNTAVIRVDPIKVTMLAPDRPRGFPRGFILAESEFASSTAKRQ